MVRDSKHLLWVTSANANNEPYPDYSLVKGFLRDIPLDGGWPRNYPWARKWSAWLILS